MQAFLSKSVPLVTKEKLVNKVMSDRPQVVILGAGASRAVCPKGDVNERKLPLMNDLAECLNLHTKLEKWKIDPKQNFEDVFSKLFEQNEKEKIDELQKTIHRYFSSLILPSKPTIYDHLVLSLRETDLIASFNWDPLLLHAYSRNSGKGIELPRLAFLHGNVKVGVCKIHTRVNYLHKNCEQCRKPLEPMNLLYPIKQKNYAQDSGIKIQWDRFERHLSSAYRFTIFGYSGPKTDVEAMSIMRKAWKVENKDNILVDTEIIHHNESDNVYEHWKPFFHSGYAVVVDDFYKSCIAMYPRRGFEQSLENNIQANFTEENPIPKNFDFPKLWEWYHQFAEPEKKFRKENPLPTSPSWYRKNQE